MFPTEDEEDSITSSNHLRSRREVCVNFTMHFFCKNTRQGVATSISAVCIVGLILTTILSSSLNPWLPISFMAILFGSCMGLFCCNQPSPKPTPSEITRMPEEGEYFLDTIMTSSRRESVVSRTHIPQRTPSIKSVSYPASIVFSERPHTPGLSRQTAIYQITPNGGSEMTTYPVILAPPTYQQATCLYYDYGLV